MVLELNAIDEFREAKWEAKCHMLLVRRCVNLEKVGSYMQAWVLRLVWRDTGSSGGHLNTIRY